MAKVATNTRQPRGRCHYCPTKPGSWYGADFYLCDECKHRRPFQYTSIAQARPFARVQIGALTRAALNHLWRKSPAANARNLGCCPHCCDVCFTLNQLLTQGELDHWVLQTPDPLDDAPWWQANVGQVDRDWLRRAWSATDQLGCRIRHNR